MKSRFAITLIIVAAFMVFSQSASADDLADLKSALQMYDKAWNTGDVAGAFEIWQDGGIWVPISQAFPIVTNSAQGMQMFTRWLETHMFWYNWYKVDFKVMGDTGLVWGVRTVNIIVKATATGKRSFLKTTMVFKKIEGKWKTVMLHDTLIPSETDIF